MVKTLSAKTGRGLSESSSEPAVREGFTQGLSQDTAELEFIFERAAQYFALLSEPARLRIIQAVCTQERSVQEVVEATGLPQPNASRHLTMLYRAGVLSRRRRGTFVYYKVCDALLTDLCRSVCVRLAGAIED